MINELPSQQPAGSEHLAPEMLKICDEIYSEPKRVIYWDCNKKRTEFTFLFRERRRGWYFQALVTNHNGKWSSNNRVLPSFLPLLDPDETTWATLTQNASSEDWYAFDEIIFNTLAFPGSEIILAGADLLGEDVADEAMERFGLYVPDNDLLPALIFENKRLGMKLLSYLKHADGFAKENLLMDDNVEQCSVLSSLKDAQQALNQKLSYYREEA